MFSHGKKFNGKGWKKAFIEHLKYSNCAWTWEKTDFYQVILYSTCSSQKEEKVVTANEKCHMYMSSNRKQAR